MSDLDEKGLAEAGLVERLLDEAEAADGASLAFPAWVSGDLPREAASALSSLQEQVEALTAEVSRLTGGLDQEGANHWKQRDRAEAAEAEVTRLRQRVEKMEDAAKLAGWALLQKTKEPNNV